jgi:hypothetical protein
VREFSSLDRCAAFVSARCALAAVIDAAYAWPCDVAEPARTTAADLLSSIADGIVLPAGTAARRRGLRLAIGHAIQLAALVDVARATGATGTALEHAQRTTGHTVALLGMLFHANARGADHA